MPVEVQIWNLVSSPAVCGNCRHWSRSLSVLIGPVLRAPCTNPGGPRENAQMEAVGFCSGFGPSSQFTKEQRHERARARQS